MAVRKYCVRVFWIVVVLIPFVVLVSLFFPGYTKLKRLRQTQSELKDQIRDMSEEIIILQEMVERIKNDPTFYETLARDELGAIKEGEIVVRVKE